MINYDFKKFFAFTLAEVLITLGIIGVVAAITIPTLVNNYEKKVTISKLKTANAILSQMVGLSVAENGNVKNWAPFYLVDENYYSDSKVFFDKYIKPYIRISIFPIKYDRYYDPNYYSKYGYKGPFDSNNGNPWKPCTGNQSLSITTGISFIISNGMFIHYDMNNVMIVDLNGPSGPNKAGRDVFWFKINPENNGVEPLYRNSDECSKNFNGNGWGTGYSCAYKIIKDNWEIKDDYPW